MKKNNKNKNRLISILTFPRYFIIGVKFFFDGKKQKELKMEEKIIPIIVSTLSIITYLICIFLLTRWYVQNTRNQKFAKQLTDETQIIAEQEKNAKKSNKATYNYKYPDDLSFLNVNFLKLILQISI